MRTIFANADAGMIGLIFFLIAFIGIVIWAMNPKRKDKIEAYKNIPLNEDGHDR